MFPRSHPSYPFSLLFRLLYPPFPLLSYQLLFIVDFLPPPSPLQKWSHYTPTGQGGREGRKWPKSTSIFTTCFLLSCSQKSLLFSSSRPPNSLPPLFRRCAIPHFLLCLSRLPAPPFPHSPPSLFYPFSPFFGAFCHTSDGRIIRAVRDYEKRG